MGQIQRILTTSTSTADGLMSSTDKGKLDTVATNAGVVSVAGKTGAVSLSKSDVGLENVDNKSSKVIQSEVPVMRQAILTGQYFLDWGLNTIDIYSFDVPLTIAYHDGEIETVSSETAWTFSGQPSGIYYLYKQPNGFGMSAVAPDYVYDPFPNFLGQSSSITPLPLLPVFSGSSEAGYGIYASLQQSGFEGWKLGDRSTGTWKSTGATGVIEINFPSGLQVGGYSIKNSSSANRRDPSAWTVSGSFYEDGERTIDERSSVTWSSGSTKYYSFSQAANFPSIKFDFSASTVVGTGTALEIDEIQLYPNKHADWIYSIPRQKGFSVGEVEQKRVYLGEAWWNGTYLYDVLPYAILGSARGVVDISANASKDVFHGLGLPPEVCVFSVNLPSGSSSGGFLWATPTRAVIRGNVSGRALLTARRAF